MTKPVQTIRISFSTFLYLFLFLGAIWLAWLVIDILVLLFVCVIFAAALDPSVKAMQRLKIPRWLSVSLIYVTFISVLVFAVYLLVPAVSGQVKTISANLPMYREKIDQAIVDQPLFADITRRVGKAASNFNDRASGEVVNVTFGFLGSIFGFLTFLVLTFYMLTGGKQLGQNVVALIPDQALRKRIISIGTKISVRLGGWLRGQALMSLSIFTLTFILMTFFGIDYALTLALIAGITEVIPLVGAYIGAIPAVLVAFTQSPTKALIIALGFLIIQQFQGNVIGPQIMKRALGLPPIVVFVAVLIGGKLLGFVGVLLAAPVAAAIAEIIEDVVTDNPRLGKSKPSQS